MSDVLVHDRQLELTALGVGYFHEKRFPQVLESLRDEHFFHDDTRAAFRFMRECYEGNRPIRTAILLKSAPVSRVLVAELQTQAIPDTDPATWCDQIVEYWMRREGVALAERMFNAFPAAQHRPQDLCTLGVQRLEQLLTKAAPAESLSTLRQVAEKLSAEWDARRTRSGLRTTIADLNGCIGGFQPSELVILGARPSAGKTTLALNWCADWAATGHRCLFVSAETTAEKLAERILSAKSKVSGHRLTAQRHLLTAEEEKRAKEWLPQIAWDNLSVYDPPTVKADDLFWIAEVARHRMGGIDAIVVDYLQLLTVDMNRRDYSTNDRIAEISKKLRALAKKFRCPVIAISQLSRLAAGEEPELHHLRESGQIEQDADVVLLLWRKDVTQPGRQDPDYEYWLKVAKQKNGPLKRLPLYYDAEHFWFESLASGGWDE